MSLLSVIHFHVIHFHVNAPHSFSFLNHTFILFLNRSSHTSTVSQSTQLSTTLLSSTLNHLSSVSIFDSQLSNPSTSSTSIGSLLVSTLSCVLLSPLYFENATLLMSETINPKTSSTTNQTSTSLTTDIKSSNSTMDKLNSMILKTCEPGSQ
ncbi:hypothetical protein PGT21_017462 [Puccinia graminis f. sp. tritici]|uniref:Uncharacterized protein n=1 Tax=Puccinia graminis f. sp. tritici TaxID=56615 RepID=A0A5B0NE07_PUCGR|nr:hypothetical protein PGT21_017462 [Puccinia graminis f. sp. tritici]